MVKRMEDIIDSILALPVNSRAYLAELLLESLDFEEDFSIGGEWMKEIKKRCQEIDEGKVALISGSEGLAKLKRNIHETISFSSVSASGSRRSSRIL